MRRHLITDEPAGLRLHDHVAWCGDGQQPLHELAAEVFSAAAQRNELMMFIADDPHVEWFTGLTDAERLIDEQHLQISTVDEVYLDPPDPDEQMRRFEQAHAEAIAAGYSGVTVVADNSRFATSTDEQFHAWLEWEARADQLQSGTGILGVCYFDRERIPAERLDTLAAIHPVRSVGFHDPSFVIFCEDEQLRVRGGLDASSTEEIRRVIGTMVKITGRDLDVSEVEFLDHRALLTLDQIARLWPGLTVRGAKQTVHKVWEILDLRTPALQVA